MHNTESHSKMCLPWLGYLATVFNLIYLFIYLFRCAEELGSKCYYHGPNWAFAEETVTVRRQVVYCLLLHLHRMVAIAIP